jgi:translation initiation factor 4E
MESMVEPMNDRCLKNTSENPLSDSWTFWAHLPHDTDWSASSYKNIFTMKTIEESLLLFENFPEILISNCMLFLMRTGIQPMWEDKNNINGGCFSYKINNKFVINCWKNLSYTLLGETLSDQNVSKYINGITISPKKNFCIIKIWLANCDYQNSDIITDIENLPRHGCLFKKHIT